MASSPIDGFGEGAVQGFDGFAGEGWVHRTSVYECQFSLFKRACFLLAQSGSKHGSIFPSPGTGVNNSMMPPRWPLYGHHFHARRKTQLAQKLFAIIPRQSKRAHIRDAQTGNDL